MKTSRSCQLTTFAALTCTVFGAATSMAIAESVLNLEDSNVTLDSIAAKLQDSTLTIENVEFLGNPKQIGMFDGFSFLFGSEFDEGIVLSTGKAANVIAPANSNDRETTAFSRQYTSDDDLGDYIYDPAKLSFDFTPETDQISFDFTFGSEEYNEYVGSKYNDRLEIWVNGERCAVTPDGKPFSVNTVNDRANFPPVEGKKGESANPELYVNNDPNQDKNEEASYADYATEMDGFTKTIQCIATVTPDETNRLVLGIVDKGDAKYDSWVFIRANSLSSNPGGEDGGDDGNDGDTTPNPGDGDNDNDNDNDGNDPTKDSDGDGIADSQENPDGANNDSDNDGTPDYLDLDSDNDGIPDSIEFQGDQSVDLDMNGVLDNPDAIEAPLTVPPVDTDNEGVYDYLDLDSDSDTLTDLLESVAKGVTAESLDSDGAGILDNSIDIDRDGYFDVVDPEVIQGDDGTPHLLLDLDNDGLYNYRDVDSDGDQFGDDLENGDFDNDGVNDRLEKEIGLKTAVSGVGSLNWLLIALFPLLISRRRSN